MASPIPGTLPFEDAAVLPLAISTAACGLKGVSAAKVVVTLP